MRRRWRPNPDAKLDDAVTAARAREFTADETGRPGDRIRFVLALGKVSWRLRRTDRPQRGGSRWR